MLVADYRQFGGGLPRLAALRHVAAHHRVIGRQSSAALSEPMIFGVAGGIGAAFRVEDGPLSTLRLDLGPRYRGRVGESLQALCVRLGFPVSLRQSAGPELARRNAAQALARGEPVIFFAAAAGLPQLAWPGLGDPIWVGVLYGLETVDGEEMALIADVSPGPIRVPLPVLLGACGQPPAPRHLCMVVAPPPAPVDLTKAIEGGLRACCDRLLDPPHPKASFGLRALQGLARLTGEAHDGWRARFPPGEPFYRALLALFAAVELAEAGPSAGRALFADFLREAGAVLQGPDLSEVIDRYDGLALAWQALGEAALPDAVAPLAELRRLLLTRRELLRERGPAAAAELDAIRARVHELDRALAADLPLDERARVALLEELHERLQTLAADEETAVRAVRLSTR